MITFRARGQMSIEWDAISFSGEDEELLAHMLIKMLADAGWEFLDSRGEETEEELYWEDTV